MTGFTKLNKPYLLGIAGGSGSGKSFFAHALCAKLGDQLCSLVYQDNFYFDQSQKFDGDGGAVNFDHPDSLDFTLLTQALTQLGSGQETQIPIYDFSTHTRRAERLHVSARPLIIVDGILILHPPELRALFDEKIFFDTPEELRFSRRLERDVRERGRTADGVHKQFYRQVKPMHDQFVEPSKAFADTIMHESESIGTLVDTIARKILQKH